MKRALPLLAAVALPSATLAQGPLTPPPGGPQPSMKTLQQVEPRTDLTNAPTSQVATDNPNYYYEIKAPGSYYLSRNISAGGLAIGSTAKPRAILISADNVTLDLNGFQISAAPSNLPGAATPEQAIHVSGDHALLKDGSITGFEAGVDGGRTTGLTCRDLRVSECSPRGIQVGKQSLVAGCVVTNQTTAPNHASIISAFAFESFCGCRVRDCVVAFAGDGSGILVGPGSVVSACAVEFEGASGNSTGISLYTQSSADNCSVVGSTVGSGTGYGFQSSTGSSLRGCTVQLSGTGTKRAFGLSNSVAQSCTARLSRPDEGSPVGTAIGFYASLGSAEIRDCKVFGLSRTLEDSRGFVFTRDGGRISGSMAYFCTTGFETPSAILDRCTSEFCTTGFDLGSNSQLESCVATDGTIGFNVPGDEDGAVLRNCSAARIDNDAGFGFHIAGNRNRLINCQADRSNSNFVVTGDNNHLDSCTAIATAIAGGTGFLTSGNNNTVVRCAAKNCSTNFALNPSTKAGPIVNDPTDATNPFSNFDN